MKSRPTTGLLLVAAAAVWGVVAWKILAPSPDATPVADAKPASVAAGGPGSDTLRLDYPDPFLKEAPRPAAVVRSAARERPPAKATPPQRDRVRFTHLGTVSSAAGQLYILLIGESQYELARGDAAEDYKLEKCDPDSLYLRKGEVVYGVKLCE